VAAAMQRGAKRAAVNLQGYASTPVIAESDSVTGCRIPRAGIVYQVIVGRRLHPWPPADGSGRVLELQPPAAHTATVAPIRRRQAGREGSQGDS